MTGASESTADPPAGSPQEKKGDRELSEEIVQAFGERLLPGRTLAPAAIGSSSLEWRK